MRSIVSLDDLLQNFHINLADVTIDANPRVNVITFGKPGGNPEPLGETPPPDVRGLSYEARVQLRYDFYPVIEKILPFVGEQRIYQVVR